MEPKNKEREIKQICVYLNAEIKQLLLKQVYCNYTIKNKLAYEIGCSVETLLEWKNGNEEIPSEKYMPKILSLALIHCPGTISLLQERFFKNIEHLCRELGICKSEISNEMDFDSNMRLFLNEVDDKSRKIFWYFKCHNHARLSELKVFIGASTDMEVLYRLKEVINPASIKIFGQNALEFYEGRFDNTSGVNILFNWWLAEFMGGWQTNTQGQSKPIMDIFNEDEQIEIIFEIPPTIDLSDNIKIEKRHGIATVKLYKIKEKSIYKG